MSRRVVVTGLGVNSCLGENVLETHQAIAKGATSFSKIRNPVLSNNQYLVVGEAPKPNTKKLKDRKVQKVTTKKDLMGLVAAFDSLSDAKIEKGEFDPERFGIYTGAASTHVNDLGAYHELLKKTSSGVQVDVSQFGSNLLGNVNPMVMMQTLMNNVLCYVTIPLDIRGVNANYIDFQASGLRAIGEAFWAIKEDRADYVIAGGISGASDLYHAGEGIDIGYLAPDVSLEDEILNIVKPFSKQGLGTVLSEAASFCVLEDFEVAQKRGATIYGEITGYTQNMEGRFHYVGGHESKNMSKCITSHLERFSIDKDSLEVVYSHGNGARASDESDLKALEAVFSKKDDVKVTSVKGVLGETNEASGVFSLVDALMMMRHGNIPPVTGFTLESTANDNLTILDATSPYEGGDVLITSKGFSGINATLTITPF